MKREAYAEKLRQELADVRVPPALRRRTLAAMQRKEIPRMKKKTTLILALLLASLLLGGAALAAASHWGLLDFVTRSDTWLPDDAQTWFAGKMLISETDAGVLTVREAYYDGYRAHITVDLAPKEQKTLLMHAQYDIQDRVGNLFNYTLDQEEADPRTIAQFYKDSGYQGLWLADLAAKRASVEEYMVNSMLNGDGTLTFYLMAAWPERQAARELDMMLSLFRLDSADAYDYSRYVAERMKVTLPLSLTVHPEASCRIFVSDGPQEFPDVGVRVDSITIEVMPLDIYASIAYTITDQAAYDRVDGGLWFEFIDPDSTEKTGHLQRLKEGLSSGGSIGGDPEGTAFVQYEALSANELRGSYTLRAFSAWTKERYETCTFTMHEVTGDGMASE